MFSILFIHFNRHTDRAGLMLALPVNFQKDVVSKSPGQKFGAVKRTPALQFSSLSFHPRVCPLILTWPWDAFILPGIIETSFEKWIYSRHYKLGPWAISSPQSSVPWLTKLWKVFKFLWRSPVFCLAPLTPCSGLTHILTWIGNLCSVPKSMGIWKLTFSSGVKAPSW